MGKVDYYDVALLPVSGTYVTTADEAAAARDIWTCVVAPMHCGAGIVGTKASARRLADLWEGTTINLAMTDS